MDSYLILAGFGLIFLSVLMGLKPPEAQDLKQKTRFYFALITLALAFALIIRGLNPINISAQTQKQQDQTSLMKNDPLYGKYEMIGDLKFYRSNNEALKTAQVENKPVFIDFYADWCSNCKDFSRLIQKDKAIHDALTKVVLLKIYDTDPIFESYENNPKYSELLIGLPFFLILTPQGNFSWKDNNYRNTKGMIQALKIAAK